ncbi:hypothetical protein [Sphingomonas sp. NPDC079357]|jgi:uncharacterized protein (DUF2384 family)|uniref:hypothetical protein n=1 Tax=Sphingomonas sp. NPDC079357 TaxID=3364518 RepID=UPI003850CAD7
MQVDLSLAATDTNVETLPEQSVIRGLYVGDRRTADGLDHVAHQQPAPSRGTSRANAVDHYRGTSERRQRGADPLAPARTARVRSERAGPEQTTYYGGKDHEQRQQADRPQIGIDCRSKTVAHLMLPGRHG